MPRSTSSASSSPSSEGRLMYHAPTDVEPVAKALIKHKVARLVGHSGWRAADRDDLSQELALHAHVASSHYDPARGATSTFYDLVLKRKVIDLIERQRAQKRHHCYQQELADDPI